MGLDSDWRFIGSAWEVPDVAMDCDCPVLKNPSGVMLVGHDPSWCDEWTRSDEANSCIWADVGDVLQFDDGYEFGFFGDWKGFMWD